MAAYRRVCDSRHLQADCREPGSAPEPYTLGNRVWATFTFLDPVDAIGGPLLRGGRGRKGNSPQSQGEWNKHYFYTRFSRLGQPAATSDMLLYTNIDDMSLAATVKMRSRIDV